MCDSCDGARKREFDTVNGFSLDPVTDPHLHLQIVSLLALDGTQFPLVWEMSIELVPVNTVFANVLKGPVFLVLDHQDDEDVRSTVKRFLHDIRLVLVLQKFDKFMGRPA